MRLLNIMIKQQLFQVVNNNNRYKIWLEMTRFIAIKKTVGTAKEKLASIQSQIK